MEQKQSFSTSEVAKFCHVTADTIRKWAEAKRIKVFKTPGGHRRIRRDDLVAFMCENNIPLTAELSTGGTKILLIDADQSIFAVVKRFLDRAESNFEIAVASDGFEAGRQIGVFCPKVVFLDMTLPGINGAEVCRQIKMAQGNGTETKIIATTTQYSEETNQRYLDMGASSCLEKPFTPDDLRRALAMIGVETG